ncbi:DUF305 domain-containing protein [Amycolatopsis balhimycina DSM 5908]|uniref:DUF305 domain-containing protein n=1 Tax=Amycolatopsis balhimycina DSM 5908 TaxID=1081091 RepID=A0A428X2G3_AMYBA|nr:DUF305 domain-containing protein [Amycolatopsis balhimycina]RSM49524.1 DUF305 domain-containing protein [Amycolatopsis balhimycina DSM 5908]
MTSEETEAGTEQPAWSRWVIIGGTLLAVLLIGATAGMFLTRTIDSDPAATPAAGSVEVGFAQDMSTHHLQAVTMAGWARDHSTDPEVRQLAFDIERTQLEQVGRMKGWLMLWDKPEQPIGAPMQWMTEPMQGHDGGMSMAPSSLNPAGGPLMPGMATDAELAKLRSLSGKQLDVYFLQLMLRHHQGGTAMAQYAASHSSLPALKALVNSMLTSQGAEMDQMKLMLSARSAQPLPA